MPVPVNAFTIPPNTVSAVTAVSVSKGVGVGRTALISALTVLYSTSVTVSVTLQVV